MLPGEGTSIVRVPALNAAATCALILPLALPWNLNSIGMFFGARKEPPIPSFCPQTFYVTSNRNSDSIGPLCCGAKGMGTQI